VAPQSHAEVGACEDQSERHARRRGASAGSGPPFACKLEGTSPVALIAAGIPWLCVCGWLCVARGSWAKHESSETTPCHCESASFAHAEAENGLCFLPADAGTLRRACSAQHRPSGGGREPLCLFWRIAQRASIPRQDPNARRRRASRKPSSASRRRTRWHDLVPALRARRRILPSWPCSSSSFSR
jgi:hypothetical protein